MEDVKVTGNPYTFIRETPGSNFPILDTSVAPSESWDSTLEYDIIAFFHTHHP
jgi:hypothetical protein